MCSGNLTVLESLRASDPKMFDVMISMTANNGGYGGYDVQTVGKTLEYYASTGDAELAAINLALATNKVSETDATLMVGGVVLEFIGGGAAIVAARKIGFSKFAGKYFRKATNKVTIGGKTCVYSCEVGGVTRYVGITDDIVKRGQAHMREKGIAIRRIPGLSKLSRVDARAVEQTLINYHGLGKNGGTLINKINSISAVKNPTKYEQSLVRGAELLKQYKYPGF